MLEFHSYASGSTGNFYTLTDGSAMLAIECGLRLKEIQKLLNFRTAQLDGILLSHEHGDHSKSVRDLMNIGIDAYASSQTWAKLQLMGHRAHTLTPLETVRITSNWTVTPFDNIHDEPGCLGFHVTGPSLESMVYIIDTCYVRYTYPSVKIVAIEANHSEELLRANADSGKIDHDRFGRTYKSHMSIERTVESLKANDLSKTQQIHLLHLSDDNSNESEFKNLVERATGIPCFVASK